MPGDPRELDLPRRTPLAAQAAESLRRAVARGQWGDRLPGERRLCELLQVSRPTVRTALRDLAREGVIESRPRHSHRIVGRVANPDTPARRLVAFVTPAPLARLPASAFRGMTALRERLAGHGFTTAEIVCPGAASRAARRRLEHRLRESRVFCCVLVSLPRDLQGWFSARSLPCLVLGSCHPGVALPSLDVDQEAVCRHAAGVFRRHGHRRLAFLVPDSAVAGDLAAEAGFRRGAAPAEAVIVRHGATSPPLAAQLDRLLGGPRAPTALLVAKPAHTLATLVHLLRRGTRVPGTVSVIARDHDPLYERELAHYAFGEDAFARRLSRLMLDLVGRGHLDPRPNLVFPRYVPRPSVQRPGP